MLREARRRAPEPSETQRRVALRERQLVEVKLLRVRLLEQRRLSDDTAEQARLLVDLQTQVTLQKAVEDALVAERDLALASATLVELLDGRLLWIGSAPPIGREWVGRVAQGGQWLLSPLGWWWVGRTTLDRLAGVPVRAGLVVMAVGTLLLLRLPLRRKLVELGGETSRFASDSFLLTARALVQTVLLAAPMPLILFGMAGLLATQNSDLFAKAVGRGCLAAGATYLLLNLARGVCRGGGLAHKHFRWNERTRRTLSRNLAWLTPIVVPAAFIAAMCDAGNDEHLRQGLGRLAFMVASIALTLFVARVFRPANGVFGELMDRDGWAWRLRRFWYFGLVFLPASLTVAAAVGYFFTATEVLSRFFTTGVVVLSGIVVYSLLARWLLVARRRIVLSQARQRLADQRDARDRREEADAKAASGEATPELDMGDVDVDAASLQTLKLVRTAVGALILGALWGVWQDVLPALAILQRVVLAPATVDSDGVVIVSAVTLWSLLLGAFAATLAFIAAKNLPAVLELAVLQRFPLDAGTRYAATTLVRYLVIAIGILIVSNLIGIEWGRAQWIVAALGVGLGFGLQEIVANFVSGLIILFERPVRVGDVVTVGDVSGTVSRLQIRATTITDFDNKEVLVPNKSFITDRVVNWTLSNPVTRLLIPVGVAYGSDIVSTQKIMVEAVRSVPAVLNEPASSVLFIGLGDSSLNFEIRAFVATLADRLPTMHALHLAIYDRLNAAGVEIPFPQRDVHLKTDHAAAVAAALGQAD